MIQYENSPHIKQILSKISSDEVMSDEIKAIKAEHTRLNIQWMKLHFYILCGIVVCAFILELVMFFVLSEMGIIHISVQKYVFKYIVTPFVLNMVCVLICMAVMRLSGSEIVSMYAVSFSLVVLCFIIYSVHKAFLPLTCVFLAPAFMTIIYENAKLTTLTAVFSFVAELSAALFVNWDPEVVNVWVDADAQLDLFFSLQILVFFYCMCLVVIYFQKRKTAAMVNTELERQRLVRDSFRDQLTSLYNRKALRQVFDYVALEENQSSFTFAMIDIDNFKMINDEYGHMAGDHCLIQIGKLLNQYLENAIVFRFGGDEYCVLWENVSREMIIRQMQPVQRELAAFAKEEIADTLTISMGVTAYGRRMETAKIINLADKALYEAKKKRNTIIFDKNMEV